MLQARALHKAYGRKVLFEDVSFTMNSGERLGLVGRNGSGKTTLFRMITGEEEPDEGALDMPRGYRVGYLTQNLDFQAATVLEEACRELPEQEGGWHETHRAEAALLGLGFRTTDFQRPPSEFSGGFQVRLQLARVLVSEPNLLLLDEPTNYLDIVSIRWLERFLTAWPDEIIVITHDRDFMDRVTTHTMAIHRRRVRRIEGSTEKLYDLLAQEEEVHEKTRLNEERQRRQSERFIERFRAKASKARAVQSRIKLLEKRGRLDALTDEATLDFQFKAAPFSARSMMEVSDLTFGYAEGQPLIQELSLRVKSGDRIAVVGKNGKGKTTLLNLLAGELTPWNGSVSRNPNVVAAHFGQANIDRLVPERTIEEEILDALPDGSRRAARGICGLMMFEGDDALKRVRVLSGGERARVLLGKLLVRPANLLLLDEPTNHLDMESVDSLIEAVAAFSGAALMVTHNERVLHALATRLIVFDRGEVRLFEGTYHDFLERLGWSDERQEEAPPPRQGSEPAGDRREARRRRAEFIAERSRVLRPLKERIEALEAAVIEDEQRLAEVNEALCDVSAGGDGETIARLSRELDDLQARIDEQFDELHRLTEEHDRREEEFRLLEGDLDG